VGFRHLAEKFNLHNTQKKVIAKLYYFTLRSNITEKNNRSEI